MVGMSDRNQTAKPMANVGGPVADPQSAADLGFLGELGFGKAVAVSVVLAGDKGSKGSQGAPGAPGARMAPPATPGVYVLWERSTGDLVYAGLAGVRWSAGSAKTSSTLARRLGDHLAARRADVLTSYLFERFVCRNFDPAWPALFVSGKLSIRDLVVEFLERDVSIAWVSTPDYATAKRVEDLVRGGMLGITPVVNPL